MNDYMQHMRAHTVRAIIELLFFKGVKDAFEGREGADSSIIKPLLEMLVTWSLGHGYSSHENRELCLILPVCV